MKILKTQRKPLTALLLSALLLGSSSIYAEQVLRRGNGAEPSSIDPQIGEGTPGSHIQRDLFEGLVAEDPEGKLVPGVAESWEISDDGLTYIFHLRDTVWSDGTPLTADDVVYGLQRGVNPATGSEYSFMLYPIKHAKAIATGEIKDAGQLGVEALDKRTVKVTLEGPTPYFLGMLTHAVTYPIPRHAVEKFGTAWTKPEHIVSNGPFKMTEWVPQSRMVLEKSDKYWDSAAVKLDKVIYYPTEDQNAELKRYRAGELDWTYEVPNDQIRWIKSNLSAEFKVGNYLGTYYYGFNLTRAPFKDNLKLRKALTLAIDRKVLTEKVIGAGEVPAYGFVVPGVNNAKPYTPAYAKLDNAARIAEAKKLYAEAGYSKDKPLKVEMRYNTSENHKKIAVAVAAMWKQTLGVQASLVNEEWKVFLESRKQKKVTQAYRAAWVGDYNDANTFMELWLSTSGLNDSAFDSKEYDALMKQAGQEKDLDKRADLMHQAEKILIEDYAFMPIYHYVVKRMIKPYVKGYDVNVMDHNRSKYMYIDEELYKQSHQ